MKSYLFILGNNPALSVAEIISKFQPKNYFLINEEVFRVDFENKIDEKKVINKIGGTIKIAELLAEDFSDLLTEVERFLPESFEGKYNFGFSFYDSKEREIKRIAMDVKRELKARKVLCRWITSRDNSLSSVVVDRNRMISKGADFVIVGSEDKKYLGITKAVQNFKELSFRDYNRPARDSHSGMIPPKLAQMMLNMGLRGKTDKVLLDPFCGSGTVLMEASLMGIREVRGTDLSEKAVKDSQINLRWAKNKFGLAGSKIQIEKGDARELSRLFKRESVDVIVTEPYLGPQRKVKEIEKAKKSLEKLYFEAMKEFKKILKKDGRIIMIWPVIRKAEDRFMQFPFDGFEIVNQIPEDINLKTTKRETIIYGRKGQRVWREIVVLKPV